MFHADRLVHDGVRVNPVACVFAGKIELHSGFCRDIRKQDCAGCRICFPEMMADNETAVGKFQNQVCDQQIERLFSDPCFRLRLRSGADCIVAIGGGSSMDTAKAIGIIIKNPEFADVRSLEGVAPTKNKCVPIIAVPTTAGTAAEVTINYVITDAEKNRKMVCVDVHDIPVVAVVDPDMMSSMPKGLTAATGMDALTHAIEGYITKGAWAMSDMFHLKAIEIISKSLRGAVENTPEGREGMALGQYVAGMGFSNVGLGIVHSMAHPLGALYDTPHGVANAIILPTVMEYNAPATGEKYRDIAKAMGVEGTENMSVDEYRKAAVDAVRQLAKDVGIPTDLKEIVKPEDVEFLAQSAYDDACRPGNPRDTSVAELAELYRSLM